MYQTSTTVDGKLELANSLKSHNYSDTSSQINSILTHSPNNKSTTGRTKWNNNKIFVSDPKHTPKLAHIKLDISAHRYSTHTQRLSVLALHDSGCAKSVMKESTFNKLLEKGYIELKQPQQTTMVVTCTGATEQITGMADIYLHFEGENGSKLTFSLNIVIHPNLNHDFLLGRDFTGSDHKVAETNNHIYLSKNYAVYWHSLHEIAKDKNLCNVKLYNTQNTAYKVAANEVTWIPPFGLAQIKCHIPKVENRSLLPLRKLKNGHIFEVKHSSHPNLATPPAMSVFQTYHEILVTTVNKTHEDLCIDKNQDIAEIHVHSEEIDISFCKLKSQQQTLLQCNSTKLSNMPDFIESDEAMSEEEKEIAFMNYMKHGYHHPSMTKEVEQDRKSTRLNSSHSSVSRMPSSA